MCHGIMEELDISENKYDISSTHGNRNIQTWLAERSQMFARIFNRSKSISSSHSNSSLSVSIHQSELCKVCGAVLGTELVCGTWYQNVQYRFVYMLLLQVLYWVLCIFMVFALYLQYFRPISYIWNLTFMNVQCFTSQQSILIFYKFHNHYFLYD